MPVRFGATIEMPMPLIDTARGRSMHNKVAKAALRETLELHHQKRVPEHFKPSAKSKYNHRRRSNKYRELKRKNFKHDIDLVRSGATRRKMTSSYKAIRVGGSARKSSGNSLTGTLVLEFPHSVNERNPSGVTLRDLRLEMERWTDAEEQAAAKEFLNFYIAELVRALQTAPRMRQQLFGSPAAIAGTFAKIGL